MAALLDARHFVDVRCMWVMTLNMFKNLPPMRGSSEGGFPVHGLDDYLKPQQRTNSCCEYVRCPLADTTFVKTPEAIQEENAGPDGRYFPRRLLRCVTLPQEPQPA
jgi:hypothetical protein